MTERGGEPNRRRSERFAETTAGLAFVLSALASVAQPPSLTRTGRAARTRTPGFGTP